MDPVKIGLVGYGFGGRYFHAPLISSARECEFVGVVTTSDQRRTLLAAEHPGLRTFDSLEAMAAAGAEAVSISTPADTHSDLTDEAIALSLSVVCDKPFALDPVAARRSVDLAAAQGVTLSPYQNRRWDSDFLTVRALVDDGTLGEVRRFESRFEGYAPDIGPGRSGGGTLLDFGAHLVDQALTLLGPADWVHAESRIRESGLDDDVFVALRHASGAVSHLWGSWSQYAPGPRFRVTGSAGSLVVTTRDTQADVLVAGRSPSTSDTWGVEAASDLDRIFTASGSAPVSLARGGWDTYYPAFARAVRGSGAPPVQAADAVATADVLEAARVSAANQSGAASRVTGMG
jgi:predicted dehydrogenase